MKKYFHLPKINKLQREVYTTNDQTIHLDRHQLEVWSCLAKARSLEEVHEYLPKVNDMLNQAKRDLRNGHVPLEELVVIQSLSRAVGGYTSPSPAKRAAMQLQAAGHSVSPGQFLCFVFVRGDEWVRVWELGVDVRKVDVRKVDIKRYCALLDRTIGNITVGFEKEIVGLGI